MDDTRPTPRLTELHLGDWVIDTYSYGGDPAKIEIRSPDGRAADFDQQAFIDHVAQFFEDRF